MKSLKCLMIMCAIFMVPILVHASENEIKEVSTEKALIDCLNEESTCKLSANISLEAVLNIEKDIILDLNGHTLSPAEGLKRNGGLIMVKRGAELIVNDSKGGGKISTGSKDNSNVWGAIQLNQDNNSTTPAKLVVNSGTIEGYYYGIVGNGNNHHTKITINGGTIVGLNSEDSLGIYHPQIGEMTIIGGTIKGGTGIEIRSGTLDVKGGTIEATAEHFLKTVNGNGSTTNGVGIAVAQHTTKNPINVTINGGNISGQYAFYEWNPHRNSTSDINKISIKITGGDFTGTAEGVSTVYSEDFTNFISGGSFNKSVSDYLTDDAKVASKEYESDEDDEENEYEEKENKKSSKTWIIVIVFAIILGIFGFALYKKEIR